jgi:hypothetical protein
MQLHEDFFLRLVGLEELSYFHFLEWASPDPASGLKTRVRPRFFDQVGHETMYASSGNKHFFTKSCPCQTYQNYEQS